MTKKSKKCKNILLEKQIDAVCMKPMHNASANIWGKPIDPVVMTNKVDYSKIKIKANTHRILVFLTMA